MATQRKEEERLRSLLVRVADDKAAAAAILGQLSPDEKGGGGGEVTLDQIGVVVGRLARRLKTGRSGTMPDMPEAVVNCYDQYWRVFELRREPSSVRS